ncbi:hypothetical protein F477_04388 [Pseudomonas sp. URIL14HWK12:I3]|nr:hypothetical protein F478_04395 [Pseudomonas sp. URIL14HWK12:I2]PZW51312.1 hypothetical protein F477_04388 [Pseudomonas sp. URIL14HWK12:I3]TFA87114.1 hypothetical protein F473_04348 [Pseudomonas sp. URIL14HWK12:I1]SNB85135.1 hypothetical protein SAMN02746026_04354 [Pseudomonas sp. LAIL14HWK12:I4]
MVRLNVTLTDYPIALSKVNLTHLTRTALSFLNLFD